MSENKQKDFAFASIEILPLLPVARLRSHGEPVPSDLLGATIIGFGTIPDDGPDVEGGGLVIDFRKEGESQVRRIVFEFNENALWVNSQGCSLKAATPV